MAFFDFLTGDGFGAAVSNPGDDQEALGQQILDQAIFDQSRLDLEDANNRAASSFEGQYQHATAGPEYDPTEADPYGFQQILGRAIVQQSQAPAHLVDDSPLNRLGSGDVASWATAAAGSLRSFVSGPQRPGTVSNVPKQVFSNRPGQGGGYVIRPGGKGASASPGAVGAPSFVLIGLVAVGAYLALK